MVTRSITAIVGAMILSSCAHNEPIRVEMHPENPGEYIVNLACENMQQDTKIKAQLENDITIYTGFPVETTEKIYYPQCSYDKQDPFELVLGIREKRTNNIEIAVDEGANASIDYFVNKGNKTLFSNLSEEEQHQEHRGFFFILSSYNRLTEEKLRNNQPPTQSASFYRLLF